MESSRTNPADPEASSSHPKYGGTRPLNLGCKIFISHSGKNKDFVRHLHDKLVTLFHDDGSVFFDEESLPTAEPITMENILAEARGCELGVLVLTKDFFMHSSNPMLELETLTASEVRLLPLFFRISVDEFKKMRCNNVWEEKWKEWLKGDEGRLKAWKQALSFVDRFSGLEYCKLANNDLEFIRKVVAKVGHIVYPAHPFSEEGLWGMDRLCKIVNNLYKQCALDRVSDGCTQVASTSASAGCREDSGDLLDLVGMYGFAGLGKSTLCRCLCNFYCAEFHGRVCWLDLGSIPDFSQASSQTFSSGSAFMCRIRYLLSKLRVNIDDSHRLTSFELQNLLRNRIRKDPIFLAIDNILPDPKSLVEVDFYLRCKFAKGSKIFITARSQKILERVTRVYTSFSAVTKHIPELKFEEARRIFVHQIPKLVEISNVENEVKECVSACVIALDGSKWYHPLILKSSAASIIHGGRHNEGLKSRLREFMRTSATIDQSDAWKTVFEMLDISYAILSEDAKKVFLDLSLFCKVILRGRSSSSSYAWIQTVYSHVNTKELESIFRSLEDLAFISMKHAGYNNDPAVRMHDLMVDFSLYKARHGYGTLFVMDCPALRHVHGIVQYIGSCSFHIVRGLQEAIEELMEPFETDSSKFKGNVCELQLEAVPEPGLASLKYVAVEDAQNVGLLISALVKAQPISLLSLKFSCKEGGDCGCDKNEPHFGPGLRPESEFEYHCPQVRNLASLSLLLGHGLSNLSLRGCRNVEVWPDFATVTSLERLDLSYTSLKEWPTGMQLLGRLNRLDIQGCLQLPAEEMIKAIAYCKPPGCSSVCGRDSLASLLADLRGHRRDRGSVADALDSRWPELVALFYEQWRYLLYPCPFPMLCSSYPIKKFGNVFPGAELCYIIMLMYDLWFGVDGEAGSTCASGDSVPRIKEKMKRLLCTEIFMSLPFYLWGIGRTRLPGGGRWEEDSMPREGYESYMAFALIGSASIGCFNASPNDDLKERMVNFVQSFAKERPQHAVGELNAIPAFKSHWRIECYTRELQLTKEAHERLAMRVGEAVCKVARVSSVAAALGQDRFKHMTMDGLKASYRDVEISGEIAERWEIPESWRDEAFWRKPSMDSSMKDDGLGARVLQEIMFKIQPQSVLNLRQISRIIDELRRETFP